MEVIGEPPGEAGREAGREAVVRREAGEVAFPPEDETVQQLLRHQGAVDFEALREVAQRPAAVVEAVEVLLGVVEEVFGVVVVASAGVHLQVPHH